MKLVLRLSISLLLCLMWAGLCFSQEDESSYKIAVGLIRTAERVRATYLDLRNLGLTEVPPEIGNLINLEEVYLGSNQLSDLPPEFSRLENLRFLELSNNQFSSVPPEITGLSHLQTLYLGFNHLTSLPPEFGNLTNLRSLDLSDNQLRTLPPEISNLRNLYFLAVVSNQLSSLPPEIGNLSSLYTLLLANNQLSSLPSEFAKLRGLCHLELQNNSFREIPLALTSFKDSACLNDNGLYLDSTLLDTLPDEVLERGISGYLAYLENEAWWHLQKLIVSGASAVGLVTLSILGLRWKNRRGKSKRKNEEK